MTTRHSLIVVPVTLLTDTCASVTAITHSDCHSLVPLLHEASGLSQWRGLTAFSLSRACPYMRTRTSRSHSRAFSLSSSAQSRLSSASRRTPALLSLLLDCCQAAFTGNNVGGCSPDHFSLAHLPRLAAYLRRLCSRVRSFVRALGSRSLSLRSALLTALLSSRDRNTVHENVVFRVSCIVFRVYRYIHERKIIKHDTYTKIF